MRKVLRELLEPETLDLGEWNDVLSEALKAAVAFVCLEYGRGLERTSEVHAFRLPASKCEVTTVLCITQKKVRDVTTLQARIKLMRRGTPVRARTAAIDKRRSNPSGRVERHDEIGAPRVPEAVENNLNIANWDLSWDMEAQLATREIRHGE